MGSEAGGASAATSNIIYISTLKHHHALHAFLRQRPCMLCRTHFMSMQQSLLVVKAQSPKWMWC